jgi:hypothetical protein
MFKDTNDTDNTAPSNKQPDRYTYFTVESEKLPKLIDAAHTLGMTWFAEPSGFSSYRTTIHIFFDEEGKKKYMNGEWKPKDD